MSVAKDGQVDFGSVGSGAPFNNIIVMPLNAISALPPNGFVGELAKASPAGELRQALATRLQVPYETLCLAYAGRDLEDAHTLRDNGICEPGPAARKSGARIELVIQLASGVEPGAVRRAREEAAAREEAEREKLAREAEAAEEEKARVVRDAAEQDARNREARMREETARRAALAAAERVAQGAAAARANDPARQEAAAAAQAANAGGREPVADRQINVRLVQIGADDTADDASIVINTRLLAQVGELARQLQQVVGLGGGLVALVSHAGENLPNRAVLHEAGVEDGSVIRYYFATQAAQPAQAAPGGGAYAVAPAPEAAAAPDAAAR